jgi:hypothetical protein
MSYLNFTNGPSSASGLTRTWSVGSSAIYLGTISWYAPWRKYCFYPKGDTVFDDSCLHDIASFCASVTIAHKEKS